MDFVKQQLTPYSSKKGKEQDDHGHAATDEHARNVSDHQHLSNWRSGVEASCAFAESDRLEGRTDHHSDVLRSGHRWNRAKPDHVENYDKDENPDMSRTVRQKIQAKHIINIFYNKRKITEVSPDQLIRVRAMHQKIDDEASFSFNFNTLLMVASILAALGLASNSTAVIIASMLVSPIMGPVVGLAYGASICDWRLFRKSLYTETVSVLFCILTGFLVGCVTGPTGVSNDWPTAEMAVRGTTENLYVALPIAFVSGLGVAVSILDDQSASLVGVAISASLLPPAVNAGLLWASYMFAEDDTKQYMDDYMVDGTISLAVAVSNVLLIWLSGMLMFRIKEVLPIRKRVFWEDLGVARQVYTNRAVLSTAHYNESATKTGNDEETPVVSEEK